MKTTQMKTILMTQVMHSIFEVMETMFFMTLAKQKANLSQERPKDSENRKAAAISFSGEFSGTIYLEIPLPLLETMTENFLGQDMGALSPEYTEGTLKEALNMVAGNALTRVDATVYMGLGIPEIVPSPDPGKVDETVVLATDQDIILAHVKLD